jgi:hypothetical protein
LAGQSTLVSPGQRTKLWLLERLAAFADATKAVYVAIIRRTQEGKAAFR